MQAFLCRSHHRPCQHEVSSFQRVQFISCGPGFSPDYLIRHPEALHGCVASSQICTAAVWPEVELGLSSEHSFSSLQCPCLTSQLGEQLARSGTWLHPATSSQSQWCCSAVTHPGPCGSPQSKPRSFTESCPSAASSFLSPTAAACPPRREPVHCLFGACRALSSPSRAGSAGVLACASPQETSGSTCAEQELFRLRDEVLGKVCFLAWYW